MSSPSRPLSFAEVYRPPAFERQGAETPRSGFGASIAAQFRLARSESPTAGALRERRVTQAAQEAFVDFMRENPAALSLFPDDVQEAQAISGVMPRWQDSYSELLEAGGYDLPEPMRLSVVRPERERVAAETASRRAPDLETLQYASPLTQITSGLIGGAAAEFTDPVNLGVTVLTGGVSTGASLLTRMGVEAGINIAIEGAQTPFRNEVLRDLGEETENVALNIAAAGLFGAAFEGGQAALRHMMPRGARQVSESLDAVAGDVWQEMEPNAQRAVVRAARASDDPELNMLADHVLADMEDRAVAAFDQTRAAEAIHAERAAEAMSAVQEGRPISMPERPPLETADLSLQFTANLTEVNARDISVEPEVFQFKTDIVADGGVTPRLLDVTEWVPERSGIVLLYEYADGRLSVADGHQRTALARRISDATGQEITLAARVFREVDGITTEQMRMRAALANIAQSSEGMSSRLAMDAARVLRIDPDAIAQLPRGPGIARATALSRLSDGAFDMVINEVVPERYAELVGRMVDDPQMHVAMMQLLNRTRPETTTQAESILDQALQAPVRRETVSDLFGDQEVLESLYLERAKVLERALRTLRNDLSLFRTLDENQARIEGAGRNRLDRTSNRELRQQVARSLEELRRLAHRAGPISEALNEAAQNYRDTGRLGDAAQRVADAVRGEADRGMAIGAGLGDGGALRQPAPPRGQAPDPNAGFGDAARGDAAREQIEATRLDLDDNAEIPVGMRMDEDGNMVADTRTAAELQAEIARDQDAILALESCLT